MIVRMWLTILRPPGPEWNTVNHGCSSELYWRDVETGALPDYERDYIVLYSDPADGEHNGPYLRGARVRYLGTSGKWHIELPRVVIDPGDAMVRQLQLKSYQDYSPWWTETDGDPVPKLLAAGWRRYYGDEELDA